MPPSLKPLPEVQQRQGACCAELQTPTITPP